MREFKFPVESYIYKLADIKGAFHVVQVLQHQVIKKGKRKAKYYLVRIVVGKGHKPDTVVTWTKKFVENSFKLINESAIRLTEVLFK